MKLYKTRKGLLLQSDGMHCMLEDDWNDVVNRDDLFAYLDQCLSNAQPVSSQDFGAIIAEDLLAPIGSQELWAAGVTYLRSRDARMEESNNAGNADCYQKVYNAERPELFFKSLPHRIAAHGEEVYIRKDSQWNVPEPELTLFINANGNIQAYTIGNDMSSRDIEGENPLYLPQAKVYERSAALGPCLYVPPDPISRDTGIYISIDRAARNMFTENITLNRMKRSLPDLVSYLFRECAFENGCYLMTGTGIVPPAEFTLQPGDIVTISIDNIGILQNTVATRPL